MTPPLGRRQFIAATGTASAALALAGGGQAHAAPAGAGPAATPRVRPFPLTAVTLLDSPFRDNQRRNSAYLRFVDLDRLLHTFRTNVGLPSSAEPCGGWEGPAVELRGHSTGHLLSGLALAYANTGERALRDRGRTLVAELAACQAASPAAGFNKGYLSAFPESFFDRLEAGTGVWAPYYTIHKIMAGLVEQYRLAGNDQALDVVLQQAQWVDARTSKLSYEQMQRVLETEFGGMNDVLADLHALTGDGRWLDVAERFTHARVFDPLARGEDRLAGLHANTQIPKMVGALRLWEEGLPERYRTIAANFWQIVTDHHSYVIGGNSNGEAFHEPDVVAGQLSDSTCENCNSYNMLKLTRLLHFHAPERTDLLDHYERTLFNQMLGEQDPDSAHGFNIYYTGLAPGSFKRQPSFMGTDPNAYSTDYDNFSCDHGTGMETQAKFADTIYTHDDRDLLVNLFVPSQVDWREQGITWRQTTGFPDRPRTTLTVTSGRATHRLRIRIPSWTSGARATLSGRALPDRPAPGSLLTLQRTWRTGDRVEVTLPMRTVVEPTPDDPEVQAVLHGPVVLAGAYGDRANPWLPRLDTTTVRKEHGSTLRFTARADDEDVTLLPIARVHHQHYSVYWLTGEPPPPPPEFAAWHRFDETSGTVAADATGNGKVAQLAGGASWSASGRIGGAVVLDGTDGHVALAEDLLAGASAYALAAWVRLDGEPGAWSRIFDLGTGVTANLFLTPLSGDGTLRYAITAGGAGGEQRIEADPLPTDRWVHVAVTYGDGIAVLYVDGAEAGRNANVTVEPRHFGNHIRAGYIGRSQYADPYLKGAVDDFRVYGRALSAAEVAALAEASSS
ncbi:beta-L-arabinofuranosidase domain-containing protein [Streptomyces spinosisporus]|uniref:Glycoside hydrolase family 127 protein n=1 Tax=Streptomyces spinosisporus TaxID=2927582 RepID=A0ABS9XJX1_9ACTN|nr:beta-L-arabinofuranosidase domain-containing protein [Streptomyces spinosisporus]MCI3242363.1 glycoside hydrolase family 127 protein [Streptomyces spinosisporus]